MWIIGSNRKLPIGYIIDSRHSTKDCDGEPINIEHPNMMIMREATVEEFKLACAEHIENWDGLHANYSYYYKVSMD